MRARTIGVGAVRVGRRSRSTVTTVPGEGELAYAKEKQEQKEKRPFQGIPLQSRWLSPIRPPIRKSKR